MNEEISLHPQEKEQEFDEKYASRVLFLSFKYSQGDTKTQEKIFRYLHYIHPDWNITDSLEKTLTAEVTKMAEKYLESGTKHADDEDIKKGTGDMVSGEVRKIKDVFNNDPTYIRRANFPPSDKKPLVADVASGVILRDATYLTEKGRPRFSRSESKQTAIIDPWMSQLCYYGFLGHASGLPEYDQMFRDIKQYVLENKKEMTTSVQEALDNVVRVWNQHHPEEQVSVE